MKVIDENADTAEETGTDEPCTVIATGQCVLMPIPLVGKTFTLLLHTSRACQSTPGLEPSTDWLLSILGI